MTRRARPLVRWRIDPSARRCPPCPARRPSASCAGTGSMTSATRDGGDRRDAAAPAADGAGPDRELVRLRAETLALKAELIELRLAQGRGAAREPGGGTGLRDFAGELRAAAAALEEAGLDLRRMALRSERMAEAVRERDTRLAEMSH